MSLVPISERNISSVEIASRWRELTGPIADVVELKYSAAAFNTGDAISINLRGQNVDQLGEAAARIRAELSKFTGVTDISDSFRSGKQEARLSLRPEARHLGLTLRELAGQVRQAFYGEEAQRIQRGTEDVRAMVRYPELERKSLGDLEDMRIRTASGSEVPFASVAEVDFGTGFSTIRRVNRQRIVTVTADVDRSIAIPTEILDVFEAEVLPPILSGYRGMSYYLGGEHEEGIQAFSGLTSLIPLALMIMFTLLAIPLKSYVQPLVIMSVIPFGAVGALVGHLIMGWPVVMSSILGIISLSGVVVNASLVLVHYINKLRRQGISINEATVQASVVRFRPIMLASLTTFVGLVPLMLSNNPNTAFIVPMAISLGWGVLFATVMTLFLVPSLYLILEDLLPSGWVMDKTQTEPNFDS
jgi:multidrug efflux pump subunit AcrB